MGIFGNLVGQAGGRILGGLFGQGDLGQRVGGDVGGTLLPFARGGVVRPAPVQGYRNGGLVRDEYGRVVVKKARKGRR